jgi:hypothetical protein
MLLVTPDFETAQLYIRVSVSRIVQTYRLFWTVNDGDDVIETKARRRKANERKAQSD